MRAFAEHSARRSLGALLGLALLGVAVQGTWSMRDVFETQPSSNIVCVDTGDERDDPCAPSYSPDERTARGVQRPAASPGSRAGAQGSARLPLIRSDRRTALITLTNAKPGTTSTSCLRVTYLGKERARIRLYGARRGTGLGRYVRLTITRGRFRAGPRRGCTGFERDARNYLGRGRGVIFDGSLADFPRTFGAARFDPAGGQPEVWTKGRSRAYRFHVRVLSDNAAQGLRLRQQFTWEGRPLR